MVNVIVKSMKRAPEYESASYRSGSADGATRFGVSVVNVWQKLADRAAGAGPACPTRAYMERRPAKFRGPVCNHVASKRSALSLLGAVIVLAGCASGARPSEMVYVPEDTPDFNRELERQIAIGHVRGGEQTNPAWISAIGGDEFAIAVARTLSGLDLFCEDGRHVLDIALLDVAHPAFGIEMEVITTIRYVLRDSISNAVVMDETVIAGYTATVRQSLYGATRLRLANEGSARANIKQFVELLARLDIRRDEIPVHG